MLACLLHPSLRYKFIRKWGQDYADKAVDRLREVHALYSSKEIDNVGSDDASLDGDIGDSDNDDMWMQSYSNDNLRDATTGTGSAEDVVDDYIHGKERSCVEAY